MAASALGVNILAGTDAETEFYTLGATIPAGAVVYLDKADGNRLKLASTQNLTTSAVLGVALNGGVRDQPCRVLKRGLLTGTATLVVGEAYFVAVTASAGQVQPAADNAAGQFSAFLGFARSTTSLFVDPLQAGVARA